jgi:hypothetical protein
LLLRLGAIQALLREAGKCAQHAIDFPVVVQPGWQLSQKYGLFATAVTFLIDEEGVTADAVATAVLAMARGPPGRRGRAPIAV